MRRVFTTAAWLLALGGSAMLVACGGDDPVGPGAIQEQNGFTIKHSGPLVVDHLDSVTIGFNFAIEPGAVASVNFDTPALAGMHDPACADGVDWQVPSCVLAATVCGLAPDADASTSCTFRLYSRSEGDALLRVSVGGRSAVFHLPIAAQRGTTLIGPSGRQVIQSNVPLILTVSTLDQRGQLIRDAVPSATTSDASIATVTKIEAAPNVDYLGHAGTSLDSVAITVVGKKAGATSLHLQYDAASLDVPLALASVADDSAVVTWAGSLINVLANDYSSSADPQVVRPPQHGTASVNGGQIRIDPTKGFIGRDSLTYAGSSGGHTDTATVRLRVLPGPFAITPLAAELTPVDISERGQVAGMLTLAGGGTRGFRWTDGVVDTLSFNGLNVSVSGIDSSGNVIGSAGGRLLRWHPGAAGPQDVFGAGNAACASGARVSTGGTIVVKCDSTTVLVRGSSVDTVVGFTGLSARLTDWTGVNDRGDLLGVDRSNSLYWHAVVHFADGRLTGIPVGGRWSSPGGINDRGALLGYGEHTTGQNDSHVLLVDGTAVVDLTKTVDARLAGAGRINDDGWMIVSRDVNSFSEALLLINGALARITDLVADGIPHQVDAVRQLTNSGRMLVRGTFGTSAYAVLSPPN